MVMMTNERVVSVLGHDIFSRSRREAYRDILLRAARGQGGTAYFCNSHMIAEGLRARGMRDAMDRATWLFPDGAPVCVAMKLLGRTRQKRITGVDALPELCEMAEKLGLSVYFYGDEPRVLAELARKLLLRFPNLRIAGMESPPFRGLDPDEEREHVARIIASGARLCFIGLGCPKQERWMARNADACGCVLLGVGNAFRITAGLMPPAPAWMRLHGCEWMFRLAREPRRLWRRYLESNPLFVNLLLRELWSR